METIEQVNEDFNVKKPKKKGLIVAGIVAAVVVIALVLVYFLVLAKPQFIFNKAIDKLFEIDSEYYESVKIDSKIKASVEAEDESLQEQLAEVEKYTIKVGAQMEPEAKKEIVNLGLEYDNEKVLDAQVYYNDGNMYTYFEGLFDKYIQIDMDEATKEQMDTIFDSASSEEKIKNSEKAIKIVKDELKAQIKEEGKFEREKTTIDVGDKEKRVTKTTLTLSQKQLYNVASGMCSNLAKNDEFLDCFEEESLGEQLEELATLIKDEETDSKNNLKISIYTKGLLNKLVAVDISVYSAEEAQTIIMSVVKEDKDLYTYNVSVKMTGAKVDVLKGKVEIEKDKDSKEEQIGKAIITAEMIETGKAKLEIDYSVEYNKGVDDVNTENSINMNELTEADMQAIMEKLMERPLIGELIKNEMDGLGTGIEDKIIDGTDSTTTKNTLTTSQNEVKDETYGYSVTYSVPTGFKYESDYAYDYSKYYELKENDSEIEANVSLGWYTDEEYKEDNIDWDYNYYKKETTYYKNVVLGELKTIKVGDREFKYQILSYDSNSEYYNEKYQKAYVWSRLDDEYIFTIELEATDKEITEDIIKGFLNINVKESN